MAFETIHVLLGLFNLLLGILLMAIALRVSRKKVTGEEYLPILSFSVWWYSAGAALTVRGAVNLLDVFWQPDLALHVTTDQLIVLLAMLALFALSHYFAYLFIGPNKLWVPLAIFYGLSAIGLLYMINFQQPVGLDVQQGHVELVYAEETPGLGIAERLLVLLFIPPLLGLLGYLSLYKRVPSTIQQYRILLIGFSVFIILLNPLVTQIFGVAAVPILVVTYRLLSVIGATLLLLTYYTPNLFQVTVERGTA